MKKNADRENMVRVNLKALTAALVLSALIIASVIGIQLTGAFGIIPAESSGENDFLGAAQKLVGESQDAFKKISDAPQEFPTARELFNAVEEGEAKTRTSKETGSAINTECPEIEQFYGGTCIEELNPFRKNKAEQCLKMRLTAIKLGKDWRKACGGSGGGGGGSGGSSGGSFSGSGNPSAEDSSNNGENPQGAEPEKKAPPKPFSEPTKFGLPEESLGAFLREKAEKAEKLCIGCAKTFVDVSEAASLQPTVTESLLTQKSLEAEKKVGKGISRENTGKTVLLVQVKSEEGFLQTAANVRELGGTVKFAAAIGKTMAIEMPEKNAYALAFAGEVRGISRDEELRILMSEAIPQVKADYAINLGYTGKGVRVAVIDTGVDKSNPMLAGKIVSETDFSGEETPDDGHGHGTHVAGIIAGTSENGSSTRGISPNAMLINAKAFNSSGAGTASSIIAAINFALNPDNDPNTNDGARIINMSFGAIGDFEGTPLEDSLREAEAMGALIVASSGNCGFEQPSSNCAGYTGLTFPGNSLYALTIGSVTEDNSASKFSSRGYVEGYGIKPDLVAPGEDITSAWLFDTQKTQSGTSMSAAVASGAAALLVEKNPLLLPRDLKGVFAKSALDLGLEGKDELYGFGLVDANKALFEVELVNPKEVSFTNNPTKATVGLEDPPFEARIRVSNSTGQNVRIIDHVAPDWLHVSYPLEIATGSSSHILLNANQEGLGVGTYNAAIMLATTDYVVSHETELTIVEGTTDYNALEEFSIEVSLPTYIREVKGVDSGGKVGRGKTITLVAQYGGHSGPGQFYYGGLQIKKDPYLCDTAPQEYWQSTVGKTVEFDYTVPQTASLGAYDVEIFSWKNCSGQAYDGACHPATSYSCEQPTWDNQEIDMGVFEVVEGCSEGVCCNQNFNTFKSTSTVCNNSVEDYFECRGPGTKGQNIYIVKTQQYCSGSSASCDGATLPDEGSLYKECSDSEICNAETVSCDPDPVICYTDADCGYTGWTDSAYCSSLEGDVYQEWTTKTCLNPGTEQSSCQTTTETRLKLDCSEGRECRDAACITPGADSCTDSQLGTSWCNYNTSNVHTCYFDGSTNSNKVKFESCGIGVCVENSDGLAYCDTSQGKFSITIDSAPLGLPVYKQPGDKMRINIKNNNGAIIEANLEYDYNALLSDDCPAFSGKTLNPGNNYCNFAISSGASKKPFPFKVTNGTIVSSRIINVSLPQTIIVTDSSKLKLRFAGETSRVNSLMQDAYMRAYKEQGAVYDLSEYTDIVGNNPFTVWPAGYPVTLLSSQEPEAQTPSIAEINAYADKVSAFIDKRRPIEYCKHVLILGDDFVVPMYRGELTNFSGIAQIEALRTTETQTLYTDNEYIPKTTKNIGDTEEIFGKFSTITIVRPDNLTTELRSSIDLLKQTLTQNYGFTEIRELQSSEISCNTYLGHPLIGTTVVLIGTTETNQAIACARELNINLKQNTQKN